MGGKLGCVLVVDNADEAHIALDVGKLGARLLHRRQCRVYAAAGGSCIYCKLINVTNFAASLEC